MGSASVGDSLQPAWLLHARPWRDTSLLIDLFAPDHGHVRAIARGARRQRKGGSARALLQPFQPLWANWSGRGDLHTLQSVESRGHPLMLTGRVLFSGLYVNELLERLLPRDDPQPELFDRYEALLAAFTAADAPLDILLRGFEMALLDALGYGFSLAVDASGELLHPDHHYRFDPETGLLPAYDQEGDLFSGAHLLAFAAADYQPAARQTMKRLCRRALLSHLGPRPLVSRSLFGGDSNQQR